MKYPYIILLIAFRCFIKDELRKNQRNSTISNLTNEISLHYTINNRFIVLLRITINNRSLFY